jgi:hypothetical protein
LLQQVDIAFEPTDPLRFTWKLQAELLQSADAIGVAVEYVVTDHVLVASMLMDPDGPTHRVKPRDDISWWRDDIPGVQVGIPDAWDDG